MTSFAASIKSNNRYAKNTLVVPSKTGKEAQESKCNVDPKVGPLRPSFSNCSVPRKLNSNKTKKKTWYGEKNHKIPSGFSTMTESTIEEESEDDEHAHSDEDDILRPPPSLSALAPRAATSSISSNNTTKNEWAAQWEKSTNSKPVKFKQDTTADFDELLYANKSGTTLSDIDVDALADSKQHESSILTSSSRSSSTEKAVLPKSQLLAPKTSSSSSFASQTRRYKKSSNAFAAWTKR